MCEVICALIAAALVGPLGYWWGWAVGKRRRPPRRVQLTLR
ncbi:hypothetical protein [Actinomycetospora endophytica]|nr:hypothetical protein [Actinomycetospora endophytica]